MLFTRREIGKMALAGLPAAGVLFDADVLRAATKPNSKLAGVQIGMNVPYNFGLVTQLLNEIYEYNTFNTGSGTAGIYRLDRLEQLGLGAVSKLPFSIRVLLEAVLRNCDGYLVTEKDVKTLAAWNAASPAKSEIPFKPARVVLQDFTGVPCVVDLAAMRSAMKRLGGDPNSEEAKD